MTDVSPAAITVVPATAARWPDLETVFGPKGCYAGCWCMFWRLKSTEFNRLNGEGTKDLMHQRVLAGPPPGVLAYRGGEPVGWCSVGPRADFIKLATSRILRPVDDRPAWSIVCFFVVKGQRRQGVMEALVRGAVQYAAGSGAPVIEAYPLDTQSPSLLGRKLTRFNGYMGIASVFRAAGFEEVARASEMQLIMRLPLAQP